LHTFNEAFTALVAASISACIQQYITPVIHREPSLSQSSDVNGYKDAQTMFEIFVAGTPFPFGINLPV